MNEWKADKRWSDRFLPQIKQILGLHLIDEPPVEEDMRHNTDLIVLRLDAVRVACRVRKYQYYLEYTDEFTVRERRPSGERTELAKIIQGWGDYMLYGFADAFSFTEDARFLATAQACADYYIERTGDRLVPPNDWDEPDRVTLTDLDEPARHADGALRYTLPPHSVTELTLRR